MNRIALLATVFATLYTMPAPAAKWSVFQDAPITRMSNKDLSAFKAAVLRTLDNGADGRTVDWSGEERSVRSRLTPLRSYESQGLSCRDLRIESEAKELAARGTYTLCKRAQDKWGFKSPPGKKSTTKPKPSLGRGTGIDLVGLTTERVVKPHASRSEAHGCGRITGF